jgi:hypothetical protein
VSRAIFLVGEAIFLDWFCLVSFKDLVSDLSLQSGLDKVHQKVEIPGLGSYQRQRAKPDFSRMLTYWHAIKEKDRKLDLEFLNFKSIGIGTSSNKNLNSYSLPLTSKEIISELINSFTKYLLSIHCLQFLPQALWKQQ